MDGARLDCIGYRRADLAIARLRSEDVAEQGDEHSDRIGHIDSDVVAVGTSCDAQLTAGPTVGVGVGPAVGVGVGMAVGVSIRRGSSRGHAGSAVTATFSLVYVCP